MNFTIVKTGPLPEKGNDFFVIFDELVWFHRWLT
jgi:hypothetical protein